MSVELLLFGYIVCILLTISSVLISRLRKYYSIMKTLTCVVYLVGVWLNRVVFSWVHLVLIFYFIGDLLLVFANRGRKNKWLTIGMMSFSLGHMIFLLTWIQIEVMSLVSMIVAFMLGVVCYQILVHFGLDFKKFQRYVKWYMVLMIYLMMVALLHMPWIYQIIVGLFLFSDATLVFWYFYPGVSHWVKVANIILYFSAVGLLAFLG